MKKPLHEPWKWHLSQYWVLIKQVHFALERSHLHDGLLSHSIEMLTNYWITFKPTKTIWRNIFRSWRPTSKPGGGGHSTFFQVGVCGPDFRSVGLANWHLPLKRGGLWAENFQIWGLVSWKFPNLGACELKISKFGGLWTKIWVKIEAVEAKISKFSQKGVLWTDSFAWNGTLASGRRGVKRGSSGPHIPIPPF